MAGLFTSDSFKSVEEERKSECFMPESDVIAGGSKEKQNMRHYCNESCAVDCGGGW